MLPLVHASSGTPPRSDVPFHLRLLSFPETITQDSKGVIIVAVIVFLLVFAILGAVLYFLHKKGKLACGRSGKQEM